MEISSLLDLLGCPVTTVALYLLFIFLIMREFVHPGVVCCIRAFTREFVRCCGQGVHGLSYHDPHAGRRAHKLAPRHRPAAVAPGTGGIRSQCLGRM